QYWNKRAKQNGATLTWAASYGSVLFPKFAGIWTQNTSPVAWNADGIFDTLDFAQQRMSAELGGWARPGFVTVSNAFEAYFTVYRDDSIGTWQVFRGLTQAEYENWLPQYTGSGFYPAV